MIHQIQSAQVEPGRKIRIKFKNGQVRLFDMRPYLNKGVFRELQNEAYLEKARVVWGGIEWPHEQDLSADTLYYRSVPLKTKRGRG